MRFARWLGLLGLLLCSAVVVRAVGGQTAVSGSVGASDASELFALAANGKVVAIAVTEGGRSELYALQLPEGKLLWQTQTDEPVWLDLSPGGEALAVAYQRRPKDHPHVELLDAYSGKILVALEDKADLSSVLADSAQAVTFSPDGKLLAAALLDGLRVWSVETGKNVRSIEPPGFESREGIDVVQDIAFSPDGRRIAGTGTNHSLLYVWDMRSGKLLHQIAISPTPGVLAGVIFGGDGSMLAVGTTGATKIVRLMRGAARVMCAVPKPADGPIGPVGFAADGGVWIQSADGVTKKWSCAAGSKVARRVGGPGNGVSADAVFVLGDGKLVGLTMDQASGPTGTRKLRIVDLETGKEIGMVTVPGGR